MMDNVTINILTEDQARQLLRDELNSFFEKLNLHEKSDQEGIRVVDLSGLLKARPFIGSRSTIYKKAYQGLIPHSKRGKKLYFDLSEIDKWLLQNKVNTNSHSLGNSKKGNQR